MSSLETKLTTFLNDFMREYKLPGIDCVVYQHHKVVYRYMAGLADVEANMPISENTVYHIYSNTKVITVVAAMQLWEKGLFQLEEKLSKYYPAFAAVQVRTVDGGVEELKREITIRDLFTMTAGIGDGNDYGEMGMQFYMETDGVCPLVELPNYIARVPLLFQPATNFCYGICHEVLAALIEKLTGESFGEYLKKNIFEPLGMKSTAFAPELCASKEMAAQYTFQGVDKELKNEGKENILIPPILKESASGGLVSTTDDYMKFQEALCKEDVLLRKETTDLMRKNQLTGNEFDGYGYTKNGRGYGLGVRTVYDPKNPDAMGAYGWGGAAGTLGLIDPENEITAFYAQQCFGSRDIQGNGELFKVIYDGLGVKGGEMI